LRGLKLLLWSGKVKLRAVVLRLSLAVPRVRRHMGNAVLARLGLVRIRRSPALLLLVLLMLLQVLLLVLEVLVRRVVVLVVLVVLVPSARAMRGVMRQSHDVLLEPELRSVEHALDVKPLDRNRGGTAAHKTGREGVRHRRGGAAPRVIGVRRVRVAGVVRLHAVDHAVLIVAVLALVRSELEDAVRVVLWLVLLLAPHRLLGVELLVVQCLPLQVQHLLLVRGVGCRQGVRRVVEPPWIVSRAGLALPACRCRRKPVHWHVDACAARSQLVQDRPRVV